MSAMKKSKSTDDEARYEFLRPEQIVKRRRAKPLAYLPLGTIEWHGQQNPVGVDGLWVLELGRRAAVRGGGVVFPVVWYGENREANLAEVNRPTTAKVAAAMKLPKSNFTPGYMGGATLLGHSIAYQELLWRVYHQIRSLGFTAISVLVGHGPLKLPAQLTAALFERSTGTRMAAGFPFEVVENWGPEHAARKETGVMMELWPELVDLGAIAGLPKSKLVGIDGDDPRKGSPEFGKDFVGKCVAGLVDQGGRLLRRKASDGGMSVR